MSCSVALPRAASQAQTPCLSSRSICWMSHPLSSLCSVICSQAGNLLRDALTDLSTSEAILAKDHNLTGATEARPSLREVQDTVAG